MFLFLYMKLFLRLFIIFISDAFICLTNFNHTESKQVLLISSELLRVPPTNLLIIPCDSHPHLLISKFPNSLIFPPVLLRFRA